MHYRVRGLVIRNTRTDLPIKKGLSSSAAISVLTARAFNRVYDLRLTIRGEMELAYQGEITTPSRCGRMDQGCAYGDRAVLMEFDGDRLSTEEVRPGEGAALRDRGPQGGQEHPGDSQAAEPIVPRRRRAARARRAGVARANQQANRGRGPGGPGGGRRRAARRPHDRGTDAVRPPRRSRLSRGTGGARSFTGCSRTIRCGTTSGAARAWGRRETAPPSSLPAAPPTSRPSSRSWIGTLASRGSR